MLISNLQTNREIRWVDSSLVLSRVQVEDVGVYTCTEGVQELVQVHLGVVTGKYHLGGNWCWRAVFISSSVSSWPGLHQA